MMRQNSELGDNIRKGLRSCTLLRKLFTTKQSSIILICTFSEYQQMYRHMQSVTINQTG